jgi:hypothetical protein
MSGKRYMDEFKSEVAKQVIEQGDRSGKSRAGLGSASIRCMPGCASSASRRKRSRPQRLIG